MPPPSPRPPQRRNTDPFDDAELRAVYGIHANARLKEVPTRTSPCCSPSTITRHSQGLAPPQGLHFPAKK